jgi:hypothetical protein
VPSSEVRRVLLLLMFASLGVGIVVNVLAAITQAGKGRSVVAVAQAASAASAEPRSRTFTLGWVGDITPGSSYGLPAGDGRGLYTDLRNELRSPDLMTGNLEGTLATGGASKCGTPSPNCFAFRAPPANANGLRAAGFDVMNLANNHANDFGPVARQETRIALTRAGVAATGGPEDITIRRVRGISVAFVGFAPYPWAASLTDHQAAAGLVRFADRLADVVVVFTHAGAEGSDKSSTPIGAEQHLGEPRGDSRTFARTVIDAGADAVLSSGPHVLRGLEVYSGRMIAYSLANFAGVHNFATSGTLAQSGVLSLRMRADGRLANGWWHSVLLDSSGRPSPDPARTSLTTVARLSATDFGAGSPRFRADGRISPPARTGGD